MELVRDSSWWGERWARVRDLFGVRRPGLVTVLLGLHAVLLLSAGRVESPTWGWGSVIGFVVWRTVLGVWEHRPVRRGGGLRWVREAGSLVLAAGLMAADGGTESPFFFWPVLLLACQAFWFERREFIGLAGVGIGSYLGVMLTVSDLTRASWGRLGLLVAFVAVMLTAQTELERRRSTAEDCSRLLREMLAAAPVGMILFEGDPPRLALSNPTARHLGLPGTADQPIRELVVDTLRSRRVSGPRVFTISGEPQPRHLRVLAAPREGPNPGVIVCCEDVTEQVTVGEQRRRFFQLASHQLRTPLTPIVAYAQLLRDHQIPPHEITGTAEEILTAARHLERLFERMAAVARLQHQPQRHTTTLRVGDVLDQLRAEWPHLLQDVQITGDPHQPVTCHPQTLAEALAELLDNGHKHGRPPIRLTWRTTHRATLFEITDHGPGPHPDLTQTQLFGHWGDTTIDIMPPGMGTRLGLLQARLLTQLTGGDLTLDRSPHKWCFTISLPHRPVDHPNPAGHARLV